MKRNQKPSFFRRHRTLARIFLVLMGLALLGFIIVVFSLVRAEQRQASLDPFYQTDNLSRSGSLGEVVRQEPLGSNVPGGKGVRVLYRTQGADGKNTFSSGMVYVPNKIAEGKPVVAWAHGTLGLGKQCAPSRTANPPSTTPGLAEMMQKGWIVTATDYAGFGTPGIQGYLVGKAEAHDVLNSVRAARNVTGAGPEFAIWGHSQGGNSALFSASQAGSYAPELKLVGTVASAPAAELVELLSEQYGTVADWVIGPLVAVAWPGANSSLKADEILTPLGQRTYETIADKCILPATIEGLVRATFKQKFFSQNPIDVPAWKSMAEEQSAPKLGSSQPLMVVESESDQVVLPQTTRLYIQQACGGGSDLSQLWLSGVAHQDIPEKSAAQSVGWISERFDGVAQHSDCR